MRKALTYGAGLIAIYLVVEHYTGAGTLLTKGAAGSTSIIKALQGR
jgi:hypothetical protein